MKKTYIIPELLIADCADSIMVVKVSNTSATSQKATYNDENYDYDTYYSDGY